MQLRRLFLLLAGFVAVVVVCAQPASSLYEKQEYRIAMRDGVELYTAVYTPRNSTQPPILIFRTPYGCAPYGSDAFAPGLDKSYLRSYVELGYIIVMQDIRGRYMSHGDYINVRPAGFETVDETTDSYDTVDWLVKNLPGHNGRVGFAGSSYPGFYAIMGGLCGHLAVKAVSPQAPVTDWFMGDDIRHNGVLMLTDSYGFLPGMSHAGEHIPSETMPSKQHPSRTPDEYAFFLGCATLDSLTRIMSPTPFWNEQAEHPDYDAWWQARDVRRACYNIRPAVLVVGGTYDAEDCFGAWSLFKAIRRQSPTTQCNLVVGPWAHGAWCNGGQQLGAFDFGAEAGWEYYMKHFELPFFERHLRGATAARLPVASVFTSGDNRWHSFDVWPPRHAVPMTFYLAADGRLTKERPAAKNSFSAYISDPASPVPYNMPLGERRDKAYMVADQRFAEQRPDVLTFVSEPLDAAMTLVGGVDVSLCVELSTTDADFVVKLIDLFPDDERGGYRMLIRGDVMRGRYRESFSHPSPFTPGQPEKIRFAMSDVAHTFLPGHRVMVQVQSSWFPLAERSPQQFIDMWRCGASDFLPCRVKVLHQRGAESSVTVRKL